MDYSNWLFVWYVRPGRAFSNADIAEVRGRFSSLPLRQLGAEGMNFLHETHRPWYNGIIGRCGLPAGDFAEQIAAAAGGRSATMLATSRSIKRL